MKHIKITDNDYAIVDDEFYPFLSLMKWYLIKCHNNRQYACTSILKNGKRKHLHMHRFIVGIYSGYEIDHINHDGLDNRKKNLRLVTRSENQANRDFSNGTSIYKGVFWHSANSRWRSQVIKDGVKYNVGSFLNEVQAALAYDRTLMELFGDKASVNFLQQARKERE